MALPLRFTACPISSSERQRENQSLKSRAWTVLRNHLRDSAVNNVSEECSGSGVPAARRLKIQRECDAGRREVEPYVFSGRSRWKCNHYRGCLCGRGDHLLCCEGRSVYLVAVSSVCLPARPRCDLGATAYGAGTAGSCQGSAVRSITWERRSEKIGRPERAVRRNSRAPPTARL